MPDVQVIHGECLAVMRSMEALQFEAVITDPPYSSGGLFRSDRTQDPIEKYGQSDTKRQDVSFEGDNRDQRSWTMWCTMWMLEAYRLTKPGGRLYVFTDWRQLPATTDAVQAAGWVWRGIVPWNKGLGSRAPHTGYHRHQCEYIVWGTKGACPKADGRGPFPGCISAPPPTNKRHLTQKPADVLTELVRTVPPGGRILDPFAGSGTTLLAAAKQGYPAVGIEVVGHYVTVIQDQLRHILNDRSAM